MLFWPLFGPNWAHVKASKKLFFRANNFFSTSTTIRYYISVLPIIICKIRKKLMHLEKENGPKSHVGPFLAHIGPILRPIFFPAPQILSGPIYHYFQSWYAKSGKSNAFRTRKWPRTSFWPLFGPNWAHFRAKKLFSAPQTLAGTRCHYVQSWYARSEKSNTLRIRKWSKTSFWPFLALIGPILGPPIVLSAIRPPPGTTDHYYPS